MNLCVDEAFSENSQLLKAVNYFSKRLNIKKAPYHFCKRHIFRTPFPRNTSGWLLLNNISQSMEDSKYFDFFFRRQTFLKLMS